MANVQNSELKSGRWSQDLEREIEAIEVMELLRINEESDTEDDGPTISRALLSEMGRRLESVSITPPPPPRRRLPAAWLALVAAVAVLSAVCAHALATLRVDGGPLAAPVPVAAVVAPVAPTVAPVAIPTTPSPVAAPAAAPAAEPERIPATINRTEGAAGRDSVAEPILPEGAIPDNPYGPDAEAPAPVAAAVVPARPADPIDALVGSALAQPERDASSARTAATNDLPDAAARALPEVPSRTDVSRAMDSIADSVRKCGMDAGGRLVVEIRVSGATGRVRDAKTVDGQWSGTAVGACAARAVRVAKLPRFAANDLVVRYPFDI